MQTREVGQAVGSFGGVNLRTDRIAMPDGDVAMATNCDLHRQVGVAHLRAGRTTLSSALSGSTIRRLSYINGRRFQITTNLYRNYVSVSSSLTTTKGTLVPFRPLNDTAIWAFAAGQSDMVKDDGGTTSDWGIAAPTATPVIAAGAAGSLSGTYSIRYTYIRKVGTAVACESNPSPASTGVALSSQVGSLSGLTASSDAQVTHIRVYRTAANGSSYLFDQDIANGTTTGTTSQADTALGDALETDNDVPPTAYYAFAHLEHMFLLGDASNPHYLWFSKRFRPEQVPAANYLEVGNPDDPLLCGCSVGGIAGVFTTKTKYRVLGNTTSSFVSLEALSKRGIKAPNSLAVGEMGAVFMASDGFYVTNFTTPDESISEVLEPLFYGKTVNGYDGINWDARELFAGAIWKNRYYCSVATGTNTTPDLMLVYSFDTKKWFWYDHTVTALYMEPETELLTAGMVDGTIVKLEDGTDDQGSDITMTLETKDIVGQEGPHILKLFLDASLDLHTQGGTVTVKFTVDDVLKSTQTVTTSSRKIVRLRMPEKCLGSRCRITITYTGTLAVALYGGAVYYTPINAV